MLLTALAVTLLALLTLLVGGFLHLRQRRTALAAAAAAAATAAQDELLIVPESIAPVAGGQRRADPYKDTKRIALYLIGTYGLVLGSRLIRAFAAAGRLETLGGITAVDFSQRQRDAFIAFLQSYPSIAPRLQLSGSTLFGGGMNGMSVREALQPAIRMKWQPELERTLFDAELMLRGTEQPCMNLRDPLSHPYDPSIVLLVGSPGGHAAVVAHTAVVVHQQFPDARLYAASILSAHDQVRHNFPELLQALAQSGAIAHLTITDEDKGREPCLTAIASFWSSLFNTDDDPENVLRFLGYRQPGGIVVPSIWQRRIPVKPGCHDPSTFWTYRETLVRAVTEGIEAVLQPATKLANLPTPRPSTEQYISIALPITDDALRRLRNDTEPMLAASGWLDHGTTLLWSTTSAPLATDPGQAFITVVAMRGVIDGYQHTVELATRQLAARV